MVALVLALVIIVFIPIFILFFAKCIYYYQRLIFSINKSVYDKGHFLLGPFLLAKEDYFDEESRGSRVLFFRYFFRSIVVFSFILIIFSLISFLRLM